MRTVNRIGVTLLAGLALAFPLEGQQGRGQHEHDRDPAIDSLGVEIDMLRDAISDLSSMMTMILARLDTLEAILRPPPLIAPAAPDSLERPVYVTGAWIVRWADRADNEDGFEIQRTMEADFSAWAVHDSVLANTRSYRDDALMNGVEYCYRVRAFNAAGTSGWATTAGNATFVCRRYLPPAGPQASIDLRPDRFTVWARDSVGALQQDSLGNDLPDERWLWAVTTYQGESVPDSLPYVCDTDGLMREVVLVADSAQWRPGGATRVDPIQGQPCRVTWEMQQCAQPAQSTISLDGVPQGGCNVPVTSSSGRFLFQAVRDTTGSE